MRFVALALLAACGSHTSTGTSGSASGTASASASGTASGTATAPATATATATASGLTVHVVWPSAPSTARASGPRNPCGAPRRPLATISTLHGVSSAVVVITDLPAPAIKTPPAPVELSLHDCRIDPSTALVAHDAELHLTSTDLRHHRVTFTATGSPTDPRTWQPPVALSMPEQPAIDLPWAGTAVSLPTDHTAAIRVASQAAPDDASWIIVPDALTAITADDGSATFATIDPGKHHVIAWLPPRDQSAPLVVAGDVEVTAGKDAELTLTLAP